MTTMMTKTLEMMETKSATMATTKMTAVTATPLLMTILTKWSAALVMAMKWHADWCKWSSPQALQIMEESVSTEAMTATVATMNATLPMTAMLLTITFVIETSAALVRIMKWNAKWCTWRSRQAF